MEYFACVLLFGSFAYIESLNPRSVNVALETVLEFDGKHSNRDVKAIDKLQNYLNRIKKIINSNDDSRRHLSKGYKFRDFVKSTLETIATFDDNELLDIVAIANNEIRKYHYKGCRFYELVDNQSMRREMAEKLVNLNELTAKQLRVKIDTAIKTLEYDGMAEKKIKLLEYLDSVYVGEDIKGKMDRFSAQLETFKQRSKRANLNLVKVISEGFRSIIFDYYTDLNANVRSELKQRLESFWFDLQNAKKFKAQKEDNIKQDKDKNRKREKTTLKATDKTKSDIDFEIAHPKIDVLRSRSEKPKITKNTKLPLEPIHFTNLKKYKITTTENPTTETTEVTTETRPARAHKHKKYLRIKKYNLKNVKKGKKIKKSLKSTYMDRSPEETIPPLFIERAAYGKSFEIEKRLEKRKEKRREFKFTEPTLRVQFRITRRANDYEEDMSEDGLHIQSHENQRLKNQKRDETTQSLQRETTPTNEPAPNVVNRIDNIEKVLDEIKSLVAIQQRRKGSDEGDIEKATNITAKKTTVTPQLTTQISSPVTEATTTTGTTTKKIEIKPTKQITVEEFTKTTTEIKTKPTTSVDVTTNLSTKYTTTTTTTPKTTTTTTTTEKSTTNTPVPPTEKLSWTLAPENDHDMNINSLLNQISDNDTRHFYNDKLEHGREVKEENLTDLDIENMFNETRRSGLHNVIHDDSGEDKEMKQKIKDRVAGHMKKIMSMTPKDGMTTRFDFSLDDPFGFKEDII